MSKWGQFFAGRWFLPFAVLLGVLVMAPGVNIGFVADDFIHWSIMTGQTPNAQPGSPWGLFTFADGVVAHNQAFKDSGRLVWWASDLLKLSFWRPLSEVTHWVDYQLWPDSLVMMHVHNLVWYGLLIYVLGRLYRLLDPNPAQSGLALLMFAGNFTHVFAVGWIAARNQMICGVLLALSLAAFHLWRTGQGRHHAWLAGLTLAIGLLTAEAGIAIAGYMVAYLMAFEQGKPLWSRARAILPFVVIVVAWKVVHSQMGYGSVASPAYIDPAADFPRFAQSLVLRLPALMGVQWFGASTGVFEQLPRDMQMLYAGGAVALLGLLAWLIRQVDGFSTPLARFYILGSVFVLVPACATLTMDRLVFNSNVGMSGFLAIVLVQLHARRQAMRGALGATAKYVLYAMGVIHLVLFPLGSLASSAMLPSMLRPTTIGEPLSLPDASKIGAPHVILVNPPAAELVFYYPMARAFMGVANPVSMQALGPGDAEMTLTRIDEATLQITVPAGIKASMARDVVTEPFKPGDVTRMGGIEVQVMEVTETRHAKTVRFQFPAALTDPRWAFYGWKGTSWQPFELPAVGASVKLEAIDLAKLVAERLKKE